MWSWHRNRDRAQKKVNSKGMWLGMVPRVVTRRAVQEPGIVCKEQERIIPRNSQKSGTMQRIQKSRIGTGNQKQGQEKSRRPGTR